MLVLWKCPSVAQRWDIAKRLKQIIQIQCHILTLADCFLMHICTIPKMFYWRNLFTKFNYWLKLKIYFIFVPASRTVPILQELPRSEGLDSVWVQTSCISPHIVQGMARRHIGFCKCDSWNLHLSPKFWENYNEQKEN